MTTSCRLSSPFLFQSGGRSHRLPTGTQHLWHPPGPSGPQTPWTSVAQTTNLRSLSPGDALSGTRCRRAQSRLMSQTETKMKTAKRPNDVPGPNLSSFHHLNRVYLSHHLFTPALRPTKATCAPLCASQTTRSRYHPIHLHRSSARFVKARACTLPLSCHHLQVVQPVGPAFLLLQRQNLLHAACYVPTAVTSHHQFCLL